jgi:xanthosine utilization system XapX-like protein
VLSLSAGVRRMSLVRFRVKTRLPAPIKVILGIMVGELVAGWFQTMLGSYAGLAA